MGKMKHILSDQCIQRFNFTRYFEMKTISVDLIDVMREINNYNGLQCDLRLNSSKSRADNASNESI